MLNISSNNRVQVEEIEGYDSYRRVMRFRHYKKFNQFLLIFFGILVLVLFLPWTQTVQGKGYVTTLRPEQRPQSIQSPIPGRIEKWYVTEGDQVKQGDTILRLSEIKMEYADPRLLDRASGQLAAKSANLRSYEGKIISIRSQIDALEQERELKMEQARNYLEQARLKVAEDSTDLIAARTDIVIAQRQFDRAETLQDEGLKPLSDLEEKQSKLQQAKAKLVAATNELQVSRNNLINARLELSRLQAEFREKISKSQSDLFSAESDQQNTEAEVNKLQSEVAGYELRSSMYYVTASQAGYIQKAVRAGVGQTIKEGEQLVGIMPADPDLAVESYVAPINLALLHPGEQVRIQFDGWPAIVFSGWPNVSYGTYAGQIVAIDRAISDNGKYRVLIAPDPTEPEWPEAIRAGSGAQTLALLDDVPIWFEIWRQINGFPPNYYQPDENADDKPKENEKD